MTYEYGYALKMLVKYRMHMTVQISVPNQIWSENITVQIYFKNIFIFGLGSYC
jgi:hypothetical protein